MAGDDKDQEDKTEAPTAKRLSKAREEGQVALSREAVGFATLLLAALAAAITLPPLTGSLLLVLRGLLANTHQAELGEVAILMVRGTVLAVIPIAAAAAVGAAFATMLQTGFLVRGKALAPQFSRLNPAAAAKRLVSTDILVELLRTLAKLAIVGMAIWQAVELQALDDMLHRPTGELLHQAGRAVMRMVVATLVAFAMIAALDVLWVRWRHTRQLSMSREDLREEMRESEGDPQIKARLRQLRMQRARQRMMAAVPKATVVITNPTHYAVAISYEQGTAAPRLVAKGVDAVAARIRALAEENRVPIVPSPPLARALYKLELDTEIPPEHWQAVAEIIAYVWRLQGRLSGGVPSGGPGGAQGG